MKKPVSHWLQFITAAIFSLLALPFVCTAAPVTATNAPLRVTSWNFALKPKNRASARSAAAQAEYLRVNAEFLQKTSPDVILVQQISGQRECERLIEALKPEVYHLVICSSFWNTLTEKPGKRQVAILSKFPAQKSWAEAWQSHGAAASPGGFAFATIQVGSQSIGFLSVQIGDDAVALTNFDSTPPAECKDMINQLAQHIRLPRNLPSNNLAAVVLTGDFNANTNAVKFFRTALSPRLKKLGFESAFPGRDVIGKNGLINAPKCIMVRNLGLASNPQVPETLPSRFRPTTFDLNPRAIASVVVRPVAPVSPSSPAGLTRQSGALPAMKAAAVTRPPTPVAPSPAMASPPVVPATVVANAGVPVVAINASQTKIFIGIGIALVLLFILVAILWLRTRSPRGHALVLAHPGSDNILSAGQANENLRRGLLLQMSGWLKQRFVRQLAFDRAQLLDTQNAAAVKMLAVDERLAQVERQIHLRNQDYEQRIAVLQKELSSAKEENRELIRAQIALLQLEMEKSPLKTRAPLN